MSRYGEKPIKFRDACKTCEHKCMAKAKRISKRRQEFLACNAHGIIRELVGKTHVKCKWYTEKGGESEMSKLMSPAELNDEPKRWLDLPHELHETVLSLMEKLFPGFTQKLQDEHIHCLECEGFETFPVVVPSEQKTGICVGYAGEADDLDNMLLSIKYDEEPQLDFGQN